MHDVYVYAKFGSEKSKAGEFQVTLV